MQDYRMFEFSNLNINVHLQHAMALLQLFISRQIKMFQLSLSVMHKHYLILKFQINHYNIYRGQCIVL